MSSFHMAESTKSKAIGKLTEFYQGLILFNHWLRFYLVRVYIVKRKKRLKKSDLISVLINVGQSFTWLYRSQHDVKKNNWP